MKKQKGCVAKTKRAQCSKNKEHSEYSTKNRVPCCQNKEPCDDAKNRARTKTKSTVLQKQKSCVANRKSA